MATGKIKGITIQINGDTTGLDKALKGVNNDIKQTQNELKDVEKALRMDPGNLDLIKQKQQALTKAVEKTTEKVDLLKDAQKQAAEQLKRGDIGKDQYDALTREIAKAEGELKKLTNEQQNYNTKLEAAKGKMESFSSSVAGVEQPLRTMANVGAAAAGALIAITTAAAKSADEIMSLAQQTGLTTEEIQKFQYAADLVDTPLDTITSALSRMKMQMETAPDKFGRLGVSVRDSSGQMRDASTVFYEVIDHLSHIGNETERDQKAMELFGKSADQLAGIIDDGGEGLRKYGEELENIGGVMDEATLQSLNKFNDELSRLKGLAQAELLEAGANALDAMYPLIQAILDVASSLLYVIGDMDPVLISIGGSVVLIAGALGGMGTMILGISTAIGQLTPLLPAISAFVVSTAGKITIIVTALAALIGLVSALENAWGNMTGLQKVISVLGALVIAATAAAVAVGAFQSAATMGIAAAAIIAGVVAITASIAAANRNARMQATVENNQLQQSMRGQMNSAMQVPAMATGGVLSAGSAVVGEAGAELLTVSGGKAIVQPLTTNHTNNIYNQTSQQPLLVQLTMDGSVLAERLVTPYRAAEAAAGTSNMK